MIHGLPNMTRLITVVLLMFAALATQVAAEAPTVDGDRLISAAAAEIAQLPSLEAKLRQRVRMFGQELVGSGVYHQRNVGPLRMLRLEMRLQADDRLSSLQQVSDGRTLWIRRSSDDQATLGYVNLRTVQEALAHGPRSSPVPQVGLSSLSTGGLPQLLERLGEYFHFDKPAETQLGQLPAWRLTGRWKPEKSANLFPDGDVPDPVDWPTQLPHVVTVELGREEPFPLFPYRVIYSRYEQPAAAGQPLVLQPMVQIELFEVRPRPDLEPRHFVFQPNDQEVEDRTAEFVERLGVGRGD